MVAHIFYTVAYTRTITKQKLCKWYWFSESKEQKSYGKERRRVRTLTPSCVHDVQKLFAMLSLRVFPPTNHLQSIWISNVVNVERRVVAGCCVCVCTDPTRPDPTLWLVWLSACLAGWLFLVWELHPPPTLPPVYLTHSDSPIYFPVGFTSLGALKYCKIIDGGCPVILGVLHLENYFMVSKKKIHYSEYDLWGTVINNNWLLLWYRA